MKAHAPAIKYTVQTPVYEGPLDLLLQLIEHTELDITVVALAQVTDQFLSFIQERMVPAEEISSFLVIAAKLLQIKSEALLPRRPIRESGEEDPGESLANQLRIYKRYKEIAVWLDDRNKENLHTYLRISPVPRVEGHFSLSGITLTDLASAARTVFSNIQEKTELGAVIAPPKITIRQKINSIIAVIRERHRASFYDLLGDEPSRLDVVVTFLALLELVKRYYVAARQDQIFGDIQIEQLETLLADNEIELEFE